uniref:lambda-crystallin homolog isoform X4 n=1 Tax=Doryrhamphus excisus TaxID=161450 RepID=UPI0025AE7044|nr:lambda-crystallin homolog isoform X4 [Doryrhamphus excisus]
MKKMSQSNMKTITVIGSGLIGRSWAMVFASGGYSVKMYDNQPGQADKAVTELRKQMTELEEGGMLRGQLSATQQLALLSTYDDLPLALQGAFFVQECVFEQLEVKQNIFQDVERLVGKDVILSSSTSCLVPSNVFSKVQDRSRCIVSHPVNPPYLVKLVELVPHPDTTVAVMDNTHTLMTRVGQVPVRLKREIDGFTVNRVQAAIIAESWRLVQTWLLPKTRCGSEIYADTTFLHLWLDVKEPTNRPRLGFVLKVTMQMMNNYFPHMQYMMAIKMTSNERRIY